MFCHIPCLFRKCIGKVEFFLVEITTLLYHFFVDVLRLFDYYQHVLIRLSLLSDVLKMDTHLAGIICHVASISATNVLITTTEGKRNINRAALHTTSIQYYFYIL